MRHILLFVLLFLSAFGCAGRYALPNLPPLPAHNTDVALPEPVPASTDPAVTDRVLVVTNHGDIVLGLYGTAAPLTVQNFLRYVDSGFYAGKVFHRVIDGFMIQGGGFDAALQRDTETADPIRLELIPGLPHRPGALSMARTQHAVSATSQFFICVTEAWQLNGLYAIFGEVESGMDVVMGISVAATSSQESSDGVLDDVPTTPVVIESITRLPAGEG
ncbi:MAG: peptidylprolyl isomerase [Proteobacteria bacterium]|nr:peptidylprolyl isomerase [Pseudomonadota bacterium]